MNREYPGRAGSPVRQAGVVVALLAVALVVRRSFSVEPKDGTQTRDGRSEEEPHTRRTHDRGRSVAEWVTLGISSAILLAVVGTLVYQQLSGGDDPAVIEAAARLEAVRVAGGAYYLPIEIDNRGGVTAQDVRVVVSIGSGQAERESSELLIDFLAGGATASGTAVFRRDPRQYPLEIDVVSYLEP